MGTCGIKRPWQKNVHNQHSRVEPYPSLQYLQGLNCPYTLWVYPSTLRWPVLGGHALSARVDRFPSGSRDGHAWPADCKPPCCHGS